MAQRRGAANGDESAVAQAPVRDDVTLLRRVADGDRLAFEALYRAYRVRLARFLANLVRKPEVVEELIDDTMMAVWRGAEAYSGASRVSTWIFAIAYRKALRARQRLDEPLDDRDAEARPSIEPSPEQLLGQSQARAALLSAMDGLSPNHRAVVDLTYFHEFDYREIAEIMACPVDTVKTRMFHARRLLRSALAGGLADWL
jgi:RNA polymerase sigma-70 factor (ECF subfamily)